MRGRRLANQAFPPLLSNVNFCRFCQKVIQNLDPVISGTNCDRDKQMFLQKDVVKGIELMHKIWPTGS